MLHQPCSRHGISGWSHLNVVFFKKENDSKVILEGHRVGLWEGI